jgi:predicted kinase
MNKQLIATVGLPGSGKSTWAKEQVRLYPSVYKRVNRDSLREMLDPVFTKQNEKIITQFRDFAIKCVLDSGFSVIVDDTNLSSQVRHHLQDLACLNSAEYVEQDFTKVPLDLCIKRDKERVASVGEQVIKNMYYQFLHNTVNPPKFLPGLKAAIIVDLDGTLAIIEGKRSPYDASNCDKTDDVNSTVLKFINLSQFSGYEIIFVSGREGKYRSPTIRFLQNTCDLDEGGYQLYMRETKDTRSDDLVTISKISITCNSLWMIVRE